MGLPEIIKDRMDMQINEQLSVTLFPDDEGQPKCDILKLNLTQVDGKKISIHMTPCEAMEIASALNTAVQFYLYNQEQYREEILGPRMEASESLEEAANALKMDLGSSSYPCGEHMVHCTALNCDECQDNPKNKHFPI